MKTMLGKTTYIRLIESGAAQGMLYAQLETMMICIVSRFHLFIYLFFLAAYLQI